MGVVVEFGGRKGARMKSERVDFSIVRDDVEYSRESVVGCVGLYNDLLVGYPVRKDWCGRKSEFQFEGCWPLLS